MVWHILHANVLLIVNVIFTDGIRMFLNTLTKKIEANCKITIFFSSETINLLFDGLAYNVSGHFAHYLHVLYGKPSKEGVCTVTYKPVNMRLFDRNIHLFNHLCHWICIQLDIILYVT